MKIRRQRNVRHKSFTNIAAGIHDEEKGKRTYKTPGERFSEKERKKEKNSVMNNEISQKDRSTAKGGRCAVCPETKKSDKED